MTLAVRNNSQSWLVRSHSHNVKNSFVEQFCDVLFCCFIEICCFNQIVGVIRREQTLQISVMYKQGDVIVSLLLWNLIATLARFGNHIPPSVYQALSWIYSNPQIVLLLVVYILLYLTWLLMLFSAGYCTQCI